MYHTIADIKISYWQCTPCQHALAGKYYSSASEAERREVLSFCGGVSPSCGLSELWAICKSGQKVLGGIYSSVLDAIQLEL